MVLAATGALVPMSTAAEHLGISRVAMTRLAKRGLITVYESEANRRQKYVDEKEVAEVIKPRPQQPLKVREGNSRG